MPLGPSCQLAEVFWVEGLGPCKELWVAEAQPDSSAAAAVAAAAAADLGLTAASAEAGSAAHVRNSFADQVRAEHRAEHDMFRAVLLGHSKPGGGAAAGGGGGSNTSQNRPFAAAAGSAGAGSSQPRLFMQQKHA